MSAAAAPARAGGWGHAGLRVGALLVALVVGLALLSYVWTPYPATDLDIPHKLQAPSATHWLGTDSLGRDIVSLLIVGSRVSIAVGLIAVGIGIGFGVALGLNLLGDGLRDAFDPRLARRRASRRPPLPPASD